MHCPDCNYALWNLRERRCPECGREFLPSEFSFVPNSVRFLCPHCGQDYYGTDAQGHLVPPEFHCVQCGHPVSMDEMVLLPTEGVAEKQTRPDPMPWLERSYGGLLKRWWGTNLRSMGTPARLIENTPAETSVGSALGFVASNAILSGLLGLFAAGFLLMGLIAMAMAGGGPGFGTFGLLLALLLPPLAILVWVGFWALLSHALLAALGGATYSLGRSFHCIAFSSGPSLLTAIPCVAHMLAPVAWIWWTINATVMMKRAHRAPGWKASIATITPPAIAFAALIGGFIWLMYGVQQTIATAQIAAAASGQGAVFASTRVQGIAAALVGHAANKGGFPPHAAQVVADGDCMPHELSLRPGDFSVGMENIGGVRLDQLVFTADRRKQQALNAAAENLPENVVAHRIGDFVFTYHGLTPQSDPNLWILMAAAQPVAAPEAGEPGAVEETEMSTGDVELHVATVSGAVHVYTPDDIAEALTAQNELRAANGLPPLPHPRQVQRAWP